MDILSKRQTNHSSLTVKLISIFDRRGRRELSVCVLGICKKNSEEFPHFLRSGDYVGDQG